MFIFAIAITYKMAPLKFTVGPYVTGINARAESLAVSPGLKVNVSVLVIMEVLVDLPVVFPVAMETRAVAPVNSNTSEYQITAATSATTTQPPQTDDPVAAVPPCADAAVIGAAVMSASAVPGASVSGQFHSR